MNALLKLLTILRLRKRKANILIVGLDNSGKTTILNHLKPKSQRHAEIVPTVGFSIDAFTRGGVQFKAFDMSGAGKYRKMWEKYYKETDAVIFVVDSGDKLRLAIAKEELYLMLGHSHAFPISRDNVCCLDHKDLKACPFLFLANKQDVAQCLSPDEITASLYLKTIEDHQWNILPTNALNGDGLHNGISWLIHHLKQND